MKKSVWLMVVILALGVVVAGCRLFQSKTDQERETIKKQWQKEDWDTSDLPSFESPDKGAGFPELDKEEKQAKKRGK